MRLARKLIVREPMVLHRHESPMHGDAFKVWALEVPWYGEGAHSANSKRRCVADRRILLHLGLCTLQQTRERPGASPSATRCHRQLCLK